MLNMLTYLKTYFGKEASEENLQTVVEYITMNGYYLHPTFIDRSGEECIFWDKENKTRLTIKVDKKGRLCMEEHELDESTEKINWKFLKSKTILESKERYEFIGRWTGLIVADQNYKTIKYYNEESCEYIYFSDSEPSFLAFLTSEDIPPYIDPDDMKVLSDQDASDDISRILAVKSYADNIREQVKSQKTGEKQM